MDPISYNLSISNLIKKLEYAKRHDCLPKVVIPVHLCGQPCDMEKIWELSKIYEFSIIEDASHAFGAIYKNQKVGSCSYSHISVFSMHAVKMITCGEESVIASNNTRMIEKTKILASHGITKSKSDLVGHTMDRDAGWYYEQQSLGFNYRMTDFQCALGSSQLNHLDTFVDKRNKLADRYDEKLAGLPIKVPRQAPDCLSSRHLYVIRLDLSELPFTRNHVYPEMCDLKIGVNLHYLPVYKQPYYRANKLGGAFSCPEAEIYYQEALTIPLHLELSIKQQDYVISSLEKTLTSKNNPNN